MTTESMTSRVVAGGDVLASVSKRARSRVKRSSRDEHEDDGDEKQRGAARAPAHDALAKLLLRIAEPMADQPHGEHAEESARAVEHVGGGRSRVERDRPDEHERLRGETDGAAEKGPEVCRPRAAST